MPTLKSASAHDNGAFERMASAGQRRGDADVGLSVALPVRNGANYLAAALDSILGQSFTNFELVVSDNASTDATPDVLAYYTRRDSRVKSSRSTESLSQVANCNRAVSLASGPWVKLFCHDDLMREDCLVRIAALIHDTEGTDIALIGNGERHLFSNGYMTENTSDGPPLLLSGRDAVRGFFGAPPRFAFPALTTATVRKSAFEACGGFDERYIMFDTLCWLKLLVRHGFGYVPQPLTVNRIHGQQVAVGARSSSREVDDFRAFIPAYLTDNAAALRLSGPERLRARIRPVSTAASSIAGQIIAGRQTAAWAMIGRMPLYWWPLLVPLIARQYRHARGRARAMREHVPTEMIFP